MLNTFLRAFAGLAIWLRYRVRLRGVEKVLRRGDRGILFLPNHPALIDPIILMTYLQKPFAARALADENQIDRFFIRYLAGRARVLPIPDVALEGRQAKAEVTGVMDCCIEVLDRGDNLVLYPAGHLMHAKKEDLGGASAVRTILTRRPDLRIVLVRTTGLWGSRFSWAWGTRPSVSDTLKKGIKGILASFVFFTPRRDVTIELHEPDDLPRDADKYEINRYLESFYNADAPPARYVPYSIWEREDARDMPEPDLSSRRGDVEEVPQGVREHVKEYLRELSGREGIDPSDRLAHDLGFDSLDRADLVYWLNTEFGFAETDADSLQTVGDVMLAATGESITALAEPVTPPPDAWFECDEPASRREFPAAGDTITELFLRQARRTPKRLIVGDRRSGVKSYRDLITAALVLKPILADLPGDRVGVMLPASVAGATLYMSALLAGKTPVMINWTVGPRNLEHCLQLAEVEKVLSARALVDRLGVQEVDLDGLNGKLVLLEDAVGEVSKLRKLWAVLRARLGWWGQLEQIETPETAAVLFTSGSETRPKAVPLTHRNMLENLRSALKLVTIRNDDRLLGILPPFHSFGLTVCTVFPLCSGAQVAYSPDPNAGATLAEMVEAYRLSVLVSTPTFLNGMLRSADRGQVESLRLVVTGAEACPQRVRDRAADASPECTIMEGYGITECSPIVSLTPEDDVKTGSIGRVIDAFEYLIVDVETGEAANANERGELLLRGDCVFDGYLGSDAPDPFIQRDGRTWYRTKDLVIEDADGMLTFSGRLKRFAKIGGEMISLPAIESVLNDRYASEDDEGPILAVVADESHARPELVLFTSGQIDRDEANQTIRDAGLSALHNIRRVQQVDEIPTLGTGKTDYRQLNRRLGSS